MTAVDFPHLERLAVVIRELTEATITREIYSSRQGRLPASSRARTDPKCAETRMK
jgi:hypothetical protein